MIWIIGKSFSEFERYLVAHDIPFGLFADINVKHLKTAATSVAQIDFTSRQTVHDSLEGTNHTVSGICLAGYEEYVVASAWLAAYYHVPGLSEEAALAATDKSVMRRALRSYSSRIAPDWAVVNTTEDLAAFMETHDYPIILKPTNLMKSLYVSKNNSWSELLQSFETARAATHRGAPLLARGTLLVEEFMEGSMHTVAGFVDDKGQIVLSDLIVDCTMASEHGIEDSYVAARLLPSQLSAADQRRILAVSTEGVAAMGLTSSALHIEVMLTPDGPKVIEIAARIGGYRARMYDYTAGIDLYAAGIATALNQPVELASRRHRACMVLELFPESTGIVREIANLDLLDTLQSVVSTRVVHKPGTPAGRARDGYRAAMIVILVSDETEIVRREAVVIFDKISVVTEP